MKKLSIITICYNAPNLEQTCKSIANQSWQDFEWIVIDGGSKSEILAIFEQYKWRIDKFISEIDNGIYDAYNKGIKLATGSEYLNFMNAGDSFYDDKVLERFIAYDSKADICFGNVNIVRDNKEKIIIYPNFAPFWADGTFLIGDNINTQSAFIKYELFDKYGLFDTQYKIASDYDRWLKFCAEGRTFCHLPFVVTNYDMSGVSSIGKTRELGFKEKSQIQRNYFSQKRIYEAKVKYFIFRVMRKIKNWWAQCALRNDIILKIFFVKSV